MVAPHHSGTKLVVPVAGAAFPGTHPELHQASLAPWASLMAIPVRTRSNAEIRAVLHYVTRSICKQLYNLYCKPFQILECIPEDSTETTVPLQNLPLISPSLLTGHAIGCCQHAMLEGSMQRATEEPQNGGGTAL